MGREKGTMDILLAIIGGIIGVVGTLLGAWISYWSEMRKQKRIAATVLYNDLRSIEKYLKYESSQVNLRYSDNWQNMVAYCSFLTDDEVNIIYDIYDEVYNYNYQYKLKEQKGDVKKDDIISYKKMQIMMFDTSKGYTGVKKNSKRYEKLINDLKRK